MTPPPLISHHWALQDRLGCCHGGLLCCVIARLFFMDGCYVSLIKARLLSWRVVMFPNNNLHSDQDSYLGWRCMRCKGSLMDSCGHMNPVSDLVYNFATWA